MALSVCGLHDEAERAYQWLADSQLPDGSWFNYYLADGGEGPAARHQRLRLPGRRAWHHHLVTGEDRRSSASCGRRSSAGLDFVLRWQQPDGSVRWSLDRAGRPEGYALLTGSSSIYHSLRCAVAWPSASARTGPTGSWPPAGSAMPSPTTPARSRRRTSSPWTGTTRCSPAPLEGEAGRRRMAERLVDRSSWRASASGASRPATG